MPRGKKKVKEETAQPELCNHRNRHASGVLTCIMPKGHSGDHYNGSHWSDAAGYPNAKEKVSSHQSNN